MTAQTGRDDSAALDPKLEIHAAVARIVREQVPDAAAVTVVERPRDASHGDYATNVALVLAKAARRNPRELAMAIGASLETALAHLIEKPQVAGPGFLNVTLKEPARQRVVAAVLAAGDCFGRRDTRAGERVVVEFVSANPTGRCTSAMAGRRRSATRRRCSNGRVATCRAVLLQRRRPADPQPGSLRAGARTRYSAVGHVSTTAIAASTSARSRSVPRRSRLTCRHRVDPPVRRRGAGGQDRDLQAFGARFDRYYLESSLYTDGRVDDTVKRLAASGLRTERRRGGCARRTSATTRIASCASPTAATRTVPDIAYHVTRPSAVARAMCRL
jgi:arginyl-tRNA synthetase